MKKLAALLLFSCLLSRCTPDNGKDTDFTLVKRIFDLDKPDEKAEFDSWVGRRISNAVPDPVGGRYESMRRLSFSDHPRCEFENSDFEVYSRCAGEYGGIILFLEKQDRSKVHYASCTCLKMVDYHEGRYIITETLAHQNGSAKVRILDRPALLPVLENNKITEREMNSDNRSGQVLLDTTGLTLNVCYPFQGKYFVVYSKNDSTYIGEIKDKQIVREELLLPFPGWSYARRPNRIKNGVYISEIDHPGAYGSAKETVRGAFYLTQDTLVVGYRRTLTTGTE